MIPVNILNVAKGSPILVELKNGEAFNGHLVNCDTWMNLHLKEVICTSPDGERFWKMPECFIRGFNIKYLRIADHIMDKALEETKKDQAYRQQLQARRGPPQSSSSSYRGGSNSGGGGGFRGRRPYHS